jgi:hypothetical protein
MVTLNDIGYPYACVITRDVVDTTDVPFTSAPTTIWSGNVDCQVSRSGATSLRQGVFVSDYTVYSELLTVELQVGDKVTVTMGTAIVLTIEQYSSEEIFEEDGVKYGTTIWANLVR